MDRYQRVEKPRAETPISENEIRITTQGRTRNYITYATTLLQEKGSNEIIIKAMGRAINKTVMIVELIKRRIAGLHQNTKIESIDITDLWEPLEEGLLPLETTRHVSMITITLSKKELDTSSPGYQPPIPADQVKPSTELDYEGDVEPFPSSGRGRGRGSRGRGRGRGISNGMADYDADGGWDGGRGYGGRGRGLGRGRGYYGRGRGYGGGGYGSGGYGGGGYGGGGYGGGYGGGGYGGRDVQQESGGYDNGGPRVQGRGRGRGGRGRGRGRGRGGQGYQMDAL